MLIKTQTPTGGPWSKELAHVFDNGLCVRVVRFDDDDDRELRVVWNVAKHDQESFSVGWSTVYSKIMCAKRRFETEKDWAATGKWLRQHIGGGKNSASTVGRWIRAAEGIDDEVLECLKPWHVLATRLS